MKTFITILFLMVCLPILAQNDNTNRLVKFYPDNRPYDGLTNYPVKIEDTSLTNVPTGWDTNFIGQVGFEEHMAALKDKMGVASSNASYIARVKSTNNIARLLVLYDQIPIGRTLCSNVLTSVNTIESSLASGTNTQAQVVVRIRQLNQAVADLNTVQSGILELLQRLGPVLKTLYNPGIDNVP